MSPTDTDVERRLRAGLQAWQDEIAPAPADFTARLRERRRRQRQVRTAAVAGLAAAAAVVAVAAIAVRGVLVAPDPPPAAPGETAAPGESAPLPDLVDVPTRGSLAGDRDWVTAVRDLDWPAP